MTQNTLLSPLDFWNRTRTLGTTGTFGAKPTTKCLGLRSAALWPWHWAKAGVWKSPSAAAGALAVTKRGVQTAMPSRTEVDGLYQRDGA